MKPSDLLSPHFRLGEFLHNGSTEGVDVTIIENLRALANRLEVIRSTFGNKPIKINSGFRTPAHNAAVGGKPDSQHLLGKAADIEVMGQTPAQVQAVMKDWPGGMGSYSGFTHFDIWETKPARRWNGP